MSPLIRGAARARPCTPPPRLPPQEPPCPAPAAELAHAPWSLVAKPCRERAHVPSRVRNLAHHHSIARLAPIARGLSRHSRAQHLVPSTPSTHVAVAPAAHIRSTPQDRKSVV